MTHNTGYFTTNLPVLKAHVEAGHWWAECPKCPGWTVGADSWAELFRLVGDYHTGRHGWLMFEPFVVDAA